jgi:hypothetical protein
LAAFGPSNQVRRREAIALLAGRTISVQHIKAALFRWEQQCAA